MKSVNVWVDAIKSVGTADAEPNARGNQVYRYWVSNDRYLIDFADDFSAEGWQQFDTDQDAAYFGQWVNPTKLQTLCYAEGDWILCQCTDADHYNAEISSMIAFYGEGFIAKTYDGAKWEDSSGGWTTYVQDRQSFLIGGAK